MYTKIHQPPPDDVTCLPFLDLGHHISHLIWKGKKKTNKTKKTWKLSYSNFLCCAGGMSASTINAGQCIVYCTYTQCMIIYCIYNIRTMHVQYAFNIRILYVYCMYNMLVIRVYIRQYFVCVLYVFYMRIRLYRLFELLKLPSEPSMPKTN